MITTWLIEHPWVVPVLLAGTVVLGPVVGARLAGRPRLAWAGFALSIVPLLVLTLSPTVSPALQRCAVQWVLPTLGRVEPLANVALFVVPVLLAGIATRRPLLAFAAGSCASVAVEAVQALVPAIGRSCDTTDWLCNTIGAGLGALLALAALALARRDDDTPLDRRAEQARLPA